jgi:glycosyltransferase involved in cell wall biosynthesis
LNILLVNSGDVGGGAENIAVACLNGYERLGQAAWLVVGNKRLSDKRIYCIRDGGEKPGHARRGLLRRSVKFLRNRLGNEDFDFPDSQDLLARAPAPMHLVHCHNLHGGYFDLRQLRYLTRRLPVVVTMHDAWLLSGHCVHSFTCERWKSGCGQCPDLSIYPSIRRDATAYNWRRKARIFNASGLYVATPCRWLMDKVDQSMLSQGIIKSRVIPNGIDLSIFKPGDRAQARHKLGLPEKVPMVLSAGNLFRRNGFKDYVSLCAALAKVELLEDAGRPIAVVLGDGGEAQQSGSFEIRFVPFTGAATIVADYFRAADLYVHPAKAETFPLSVLEAGACGIPIIASAVGGVPEQIEDGHTGYLVDPGNPDDLARKIMLVLSDGETRNAMGYAAALVAQRKFGADRMTRDYLGWFEEIMESDRISGVAA